MPVSAQELKSVLWEAANIRFHVPEGCHWRDIRDAPANVGAALAKDGNLSIPRYVRKAAASSPGETQDLATAWSSFEQEGRAFWTEMDSLVEMLDGLVASGSGDQ